MAAEPTITAVSVAAPQWARMKGVSGRPVQSLDGSQWVGTLRIEPSQEHGSVFTVRDFDPETGGAAAGGGETGWRF